MKNMYKEIRTAVAFKKYTGNIYEIHGDNTEEELNTLLTKNIEFNDINSSGHSFILTEEGKVSADVIFYKLENTYILLSKKELSNDLAELEDVVVENKTEEWCMVQIEGKQSSDLLQHICEFDLSLLNYKAILHTNYQHKPLSIARIGHTGELGYQILLPASLYETCVEELFTQHDVMTYDEAIEDYTKFEVGNPIDTLLSLESFSVHELGYTWNIDLTKASFKGKEALCAIIEEAKYYHIGFYSETLQKVGTKVLFEDNIVGDIVFVTEALETSQGKACLGSLMLLEDYAYSGITFILENGDTVHTMASPYVIPESWGNK